MAARVSSALFSRARSFSSCCSRVDVDAFRKEVLEDVSELARLLDTCYSAFASACPLNIQSYQRTLDLGEVSNDFLDRRREPSDQCWNGNDLIALRQLRLLQQVDDFNT